MQDGYVGICEDDAELRSILREALERDGLRVRAVGTGTQAVEAFAHDPPGALVLDIGLPDSDGRDVCQALRAHGVTAPVIFLTARAGLTDRLSGFNAGGDDYLAKPFEISELLVRVRALLRRARTPPAAEGTGLQLDPSAHAVRHGTRKEPLTPTEFRLLGALVARAGEVVRRNELRLAAWPDGAMVSDNTLDTYIGRLRRKLTAIEAEGAIETARGVGYSLR